MLLTVGPAATETLDDADCLIVRADGRGHIVFISETCRRMGYDPADLIGQPAVAFVHPEDRAKFIANSAGLHGPTAGPPPADRRHRYRCADGSWVWLEGHPTVIPTPDGRRGDIVNVFRILED